MKPNFLIASIICASITITGCSSDDDSTTEQEMPEEIPVVITEEGTMSPLTLNLQGLSNLGDSEVYEGWIMVNGIPQTTGIFTVNDAGMVSQTSFQVETTDLESATAFILSVEPANDTDPAPSDIKILSGAFSGDSAMVNTTEMIGDFTGISGTFFLRSPTDEMMGTANNMNDQYGVWFGDIDQGMPPIANFVLPMLDDSKWVYEGWVVADGTPISTGRFTAFDMQDDFNGHSGTAGTGPNLPGEDFFNNPPMGVMFPLDVRNRMVIISVEPAVNDDPAPFLLKPLLATADMTLVQNQSFMMNSSAIPSGTVAR